MNMSEVELPHFSFTSVNSRLQVVGDTYLEGRGNFDAFLMFFCVLSIFLGEFGIIGEGEVTPRR